MTVVSAPESFMIHTLSLPGGEHVTVRPAGPGDAETLQAYVRELSASARYNRFFGAVSELPPAELRRAIQMNEPGQATLIAEIGGSRSAIGELRYAVVSDTACEFAISVADDWRGRGLGSLLLGDAVPRPSTRRRTLGGRCSAVERDDVDICNEGRFRNRTAVPRSAGSANCQRHDRQASKNGL
jgi:hypothetical protein